MDPFPIDKRWQSLYRRIARDTHSDKPDREMDWGAEQDTNNPGTGTD